MPCTYNFLFWHRRSCPWHQTECLCICPFFKKEELLEFAFVMHTRRKITKRDELSFRTVLALPALCVSHKANAQELVPNASRIGLDSRMSCSTRLVFFFFSGPRFLIPPVFKARYCSINLVASVFPAPDSPLEVQTEN